MMMKTITISDEQCQTIKVSLRRHIKDLLVENKDDILPNDVAETITELHELIEEVAGVKVKFKTLNAGDAFIDDFGVTWVKSESFATATVTSKEDSGWAENDPPFEYPTGDHYFNCEWKVTKIEK